MSLDEAVAEANEAAPPDAPILKIRARAADSILGSASFETIDAASARRWLFLFEPLLRYGPRAALAAGLVGFAGVAAPIFQGVSCPFPRGCHSLPRSTGHNRAASAPRSSAWSTKWPTKSALSNYWLRVFLFLAKENQREGCGFEEMQC